METLDLCLFNPDDVRWSLDGVTIAGGVSVAGMARSALTDGGGFWTCTMSGIWLESREKLKAALALEGRLDRGATPLLVPYRDVHLGPVSPAGQTLRMGSVFSRGAPLRATEVRISATAGVPVTGGEHFGVDHATKGRRMYRVVDVVSSQGLTQVVKIRPPLREAVTTQAVDFKSPSCAMRMVNAKDCFEAIQLGRVSAMNPVFVEALDAA